MSHPPYCHSSSSRSQECVPRGSVRCSSSGHEAQPEAEDPGLDAAHLRPSSWGTQGWICRACGIMISSLTCGECTPRPRRREASPLPAPLPVLASASPTAWTEILDGLTCGVFLSLTRLEGKKQVSYGALATPGAFTGLRRCSTSFRDSKRPQEGKGRAMVCGAERRWTSTLITLRWRQTRAPQRCCRLGARRVPFATGRQGRKFCSNCRRKAGQARRRVGEEEEPQVGRGGSPPPRRNNTFLSRLAARRAFKMAR